MTRWPIEGPQYGVSARPARLLGSFARTPSGTDDEIDGGMRTVIALFQHQAPLAVTGDLDKPTMRKLIAFHGS